MDRKSDRIVWMDCEMTGLEIDKHTIVEIAVIVTDADLKTVAEGPNIVIHQDEETLSRMNDWCKDKFSKNGLIERIRASKVEMAEAEEQILAFLKIHVLEKTAILTGNSIYMDRFYVMKYMPRLDAYLHHRLIDVDSISEASYRLYPQSIACAPKKKMVHRALDDIKEAISELKYYKTLYSDPGYWSSNPSISLAQFDARKKTYDKADRLAWMDCKMDEVVSNTIEMAVIVTDRKLNIVAEGPNIIIRLDDHMLSSMNSSCKEAFAKNGLMGRNRECEMRMAEAENKLLVFLKKHFVINKGRLAGNSIYMERIFIRKYMPRVNAFLNHHIIDVDSISELARRWVPSSVESAPIRSERCGAIDEIRASIKELNHYHSCVFK